MMHNRKTREMMELWKGKGRWLKPLLVGRQELTWFAAFAVLLPTQDKPPVIETSAWIFRWQRSLLQAAHQMDFSKCSRSLMRTHLQPQLHHTCLPQPCDLNGFILSDYNPVQDLGHASSHLSK